MPPIWEVMDTVPRALCLVFEYLTKFHPRRVHITITDADAPAEPVIPKGRDAHED